jgi:hypothetical protein
MTARAGSRIAAVTATPARGLDEDMPLLLRALVAAGVEPHEVVWDDPAVDWSGFALAVVRSTWDYFARRDEFVAWAERVAATTALHNPVALLRWNSDKRYLRDLERAGVAIVPTTFALPGSPVTLPPGEDLMIKPAVSAGSNDTARYRDGDRAAARQHVERLLAAGRVAMVQPYQAAVDSQGETALVYFDGRFSHAIEKAAIFASGPQMVGGLFAREEIRPRTPSPFELRAGEAVLAALSAGGLAGLAPPLYARVDLVPLADGTPALLELELCEPSLFLGFAAGAADGLAAAIIRRLDLARAR